MPRGDLHEIRAGFLPLLDSAILVVAREKGFAKAEAIDLTLIRETSWANIRDRMAVGHFQVAHMLGPMPIAARLSLTPLHLDVVAPMALGLGGNAVTVSCSLAEVVTQEQNPNDLDAAINIKHLARAVHQHNAENETPLSFAVVHPFSAHNYDLRYWLAAGGIDPERDVRIVVVPPPLMADALKSGQIDGFCVGEPWNSLAVALGAGVMITTKSAIWRSSPEKVLAVPSSLVSEQPSELAAVIRALYRSADWCGRPENHEELAAILSRAEYVGQDQAVILPALQGRLRYQGKEIAEVQDFFVPFNKAATFPWQSHALWFYSQMVRWGHASWSPESAGQAAEVYRPDLYRAAIAPLGEAVPAANSKVEGALKTPTHVGSSDGSLILGPDGFFDDRIFDPEQIEAYVQAQRA